ncbi:MAG: 3-octaprenyl-4-hydroxybenzoate carboxy-lyase [Candidatus Desulfovibrio kirbyi]|uniref:Flavin prenyltransferase UbiX n=1 Tax=Candidatus Desulfovibrio kirbyi TaxID=2696086 RepID=A0A6L2R678_9BACT|nr:MAG: 3-octaprenyl-4-hydroxybenzoate carboxy-lyase [Candidatus Desulfovibrio kirbyi]
MRRILVGVSGASGMPLTVQILRNLAEMPDVEVHCVVSYNALAVLQTECGTGTDVLSVYADRMYAPNNLSAGPSSGSWWYGHKSGEQPCSMMIVPCSMSTLGALASGVTRNLVQRAADVALKEGMRLVLVPRESPLSAVHLRNMLALREAGAVMMPFSPGFYLRPQSLEELLQQTCARIFDQLGLAHGLARWSDE